MLASALGDNRHFACVLVHHRKVFSESGHIALLAKKAGLAVNNHLRDVTMSRAKTQHTRCHGFVHAPRLTPPLPIYHLEISLCFKPADSPIRTCIVHDDNLRFEFPFSTRGNRFWQRPQPIFGGKYYGNVQLHHHLIITQGSLIMLYAHFPK